MKRVTVVLGILVSMAFVPAAWAVRASFFEVATPVQLRKGKLDDMVAAEPGRLTLAFDKKELLKADGEIIWSLVVDRTGAVTAGTSHKGQIYVIRGGKSSVTATVSGAALFAGVLGPDGKIYLGGSPSGTIYVDGKVFCKTGESYIWSMLFDAKGNLYAATGPDGKLLRIDRKGKVTVALDSPDPHLMSLVRDSRGNIYAGSSKSGLIYRLSGDGKSKVIYDAAEGEIRALAVDDKDRLYFGTADVTSARGRSSGPVGMSAARAMGPPPGGGGPGGSPRGGGPPVTRPSSPARIRDDVSATNAVYRMAPDGSVIQLHSIRGKMIMSMLWMDGKLYVGTGNRGDLILIDENLDVTVLEENLEKQVLSLARGRDGALLMGTADSGRVIRYAAGFVKKGLYTSEVFDAKFVARFGALSWTGVLPAGTGVEMTTQTGNVAEVDASWSEWSKPNRSSGETVKSPPGRFIRYRIEAKTVNADVTPRIDEVRIAYLTSNQPPRVKVVKVVTPAKKNEKAKKPVGAGQVDISWQAADPNGDKMRYRVEFRRLGDAKWRVLEEKTDKPTYAWKTKAVPDGTYEIRIEASDAPDNPSSVALSHTRISQPFFVDNTRPVVVLAVQSGVGKATVNVTLSDKAGSIITSAEYSLDSGDWQALLPDDRIFDAQTERATVELKDLEPGEHTIAVRASDANANQGAGSRTFKTR